jgi:hypothetical protein
MTIMPSHKPCILDHIARIILLLSDTPSYWFSINSKNSTPLANDEHDNKRSDGGNRQRRWAMAFSSGIGVWRQGGTGENDVWQW